MTTGLVGSFFPKTNSSGLGAESPNPFREAAPNRERFGGWLVLHGQRSSCATWRAERRGEVVLSRLGDVQGVCSAPGEKRFCWLGAFINRPGRCMCAETPSVRYNGSRVWR